MTVRKLVAFVMAAVLAAGTFALTGCGPKSTSQGSGGQSQNGSNLSGSLNIEGSDTMVNMAQAWAEKFQASNPGVMISVKGGGSGNGIAALINGTVDFADASREIKAEEIDQAKKNGIDPVATVVAKDGISVVVNPANGVKDLSLDQLGKIYRGEITNWKDVGGNDAEIVLLGRDTSSGTYEFFSEAVVGKDAQYAKTMRNLGSNQEIVSEVEGNANAIGYVGFGYAQQAGDKVKRLTLGGVEDTVANVKSKAYPLSRDLYMYSNGQPKDLGKAYVDWILGADGQKIVEDQGFVSIK